MIAANTAGLSLLPVFVGPVSLSRGVLAQNTDAKRARSGEK